FYFHGFPLFFWSTNWYHFLFNSSGNSCISGSPQISARLDFINTGIFPSLHLLTICSIHFLSGTTLFFLCPVSAPMIVHFECGAATISRSGSILSNVLYRESYQ